MIFFLLKKKWKSFFAIKQNWVEVLIQALWLLFLIFLAIFTAFVYEGALQYSINIKQSFIVKIVNYFLLVLPLLLKFFPSLTLRKTFFKKNYPLTKIRMVTFELLYSVYSETWIFFMIIFCLVLYAFCSFSLTQLIVLISLGLCGILLAENFINAYYTRKILHFFFTLILSICLILLMGRPFFTDYPFLLCDSAFILLIFGYYLFYKPNNEPLKFGTKSLFPQFKYIILKIILKTKSYRYASILAVILQSIMAIIFIELLRKYAQVIIFNLISFSLLFSFCYNNTWGYFRSSIFNMIIAGNTMRDMILMFIKIILPGIFLNLIFLVPCLILFPKFLSWKLLIGFIVITIFSIVLSLVFSFIRFEFITEIFSFRVKNHTSSPLATHIISIASLLLGFTQKNDFYFFIMITIIMILTTIAVIILYRKQENLIKILRNKIIKSSNI